MTSSSVAPSPSGAGGAPVERADVIVVGAGPGGSATAAYLADHGLDVVLLEKSAFPRDKICGDGLTPRATKELISLGVDTTGWQRTKGLRIKGGGHTLAARLARVRGLPVLRHGAHPRPARRDPGPARREQGRPAPRAHERHAPVRDSSGRVAGVTAKRLDDAGRATGETVSYRAPVVVASDGVSSRLATPSAAPSARTASWASPCARTTDAPSATTTSRATSSCGPVTTPATASSCPATAGSSRSRTAAPTSASAPSTPPRPSRRPTTRTSCVAGSRTSPRVALEHDESAGPIRGAALPMGFNRTPLYADGLLLVGDSGGMVNPFNGEGIDYALEAARVGAELVAQAMARPSDAERERVLAAYPKVMKDELGGYFTLGRWFAHAIGNPEVMRLATKYGLPRTTLMPFLLKMHGQPARPGRQGASDRLINSLSRLAPAHERHLAGLLVTPSTIARRP